MDSVSINTKYRVLRADVGSLQKGTIRREILEHLLDRCSITSLEALGVYGTQRVAARIMELRSMGVEITSDRRADSMGKRYVKYLLRPGQVRRIRTLLKRLDS